MTSGVTQFTPHHPSRDIVEFSPPLASHAPHAHTPHPARHALPLGRRMFDVKCSMLPLHFCLLPFAFCLPPPSPTIPHPMLLRLLKAKIHRATVTFTDVNYHGSITIDSDLLKAPGLYPNAAVLVAHCP